MTPRHAVPLKWPPDWTALALAFTAARWRWCAPDCNPDCGPIRTTLPTAQRIADEAAALRDEQLSRPDQSSYLMCGGLFVWNDAGVVAFGVHRKIAQHLQPMGGQS